MRARAREHAWPLPFVSIVVKPIDISTHRAGTRRWTLTMASAFALGLSPFAHGAAQQDSASHRMPGMSGMPMPDSIPRATPDTTDMHGMHGMPGMGAVSMDGPLGIPMERTGSGTTWLPDVTPMHAYHATAGSWELMLHGVAFGLYDKQGSRRGAERFTSVNWGMLMATRQLGSGRLQLRGMMSAEPF